MTDDSQDIATDFQEETVFLVGFTLMKVQFCERSLGQCLTIIFSTQEKVTTEDLYRMDQTHFDATLGQIKRKMKEKFDIRPDFETILTDFVRDRNRFVHRLFSEEGHTLDTDESCSKVRPFLSNLGELADKIGDMMADFSTVCLSGDNDSIPDEIPVELRGRFEDALRNRPLLKELLKNKPRTK